MNKKFSTLAVSLLLTSAFSVNAQVQGIGYDTNHTATPSGPVGGETAYRTQLTLSDVFDKFGSDDTNVDEYNKWTVNKIESEKWYQLQVGEKDEVLVQLRDYTTGELYLKVVSQNKLTTGKKPEGNPTLTSSLWKIEVQDKGGYQRGKTYVFTNKETGYMLSYNCPDRTVDPQAAVKLNDKSDVTGGKIDKEKSIIKSDISAWQWYSDDDISKTGESFGAVKLYAYIHEGQEVMGLVRNDNDEIVSVKIAKDKVTDRMANIDFLALTIRDAGVRVLTAEDINSMIDADGSWMNAADREKRDRVFFKSAPAVVNDLFTGSYKAHNTTIEAFKSKNYATEKYAGYSIVLQKADDKFFMVDEDLTYEDVQEPTLHGGLQVHDKNFTGGLNALLGGNMTALKARYYWKISYYPTPDSLVLEPLNASFIGAEDKKADKKWADTPLKNAAVEAFYNTVNAATAHASGVASATTSVPFNKDAYIPVALKIMNQTSGIDDKSVLTVGQSKNTAVGKEDFAKAKYGRPVLTDNIAEMGIKLGFKHDYTPMKRATLENGLYFIKVKVDAAHKTDYRKDGMNLVMNLWGQLMYDKQDDYQEYKHMPATQWVVEQDVCEIGPDQTPYVTIRNREYGSESNIAFHGQLYKAGENTYYFINHKDYNIKSDNVGKFPDMKFSCGDTLVFDQITDKSVTENGKLGYKNFTKDALAYETWGVKYSTADTYQGLNNDKYLNVNENDGYLVVENNQWKDFEVAVLAENNFGYGSEKAGVAALSRTVYTLKVRDNNLIDNNWKYIVVKDDENGNPYYQMAHLKDVDGKNVKLGTFYFKADQLTADGDTSYVFVDATGWTKTADFKKEGWATFTGVLNSVNEYDYAKYPERLYIGNGFKQLGVKSQTTKSTYVTLDTDPETVNDAFVFVSTNRPLYMPIGLDITNGEMNTVTNIFRKRGNAGIGQATEYLFEDGNNQSNVAEGSYIKGFQYLGITAEGVKPLGEKSTTALYVDSVISSNPRMPQYLFMVDVDSVKDGRWCNTNKHGYFPSEDVADEEDATHHIFYNGYVAGRVLVNLNDSVELHTSINMLDEAKKFGYRNFTRLAFVEGIHMNITAEEANTAFAQPAGEWLFILKGDLKLKDLITTVGDYKVIDAKKFNDAFTDGKIDRKTLDGKHQNYAFSLRYTDDDHQDVLLESKGNDENKVSKIGGFSENSWVQIMDGVPVLAQSKNINGDHTAIDGTTSLSQLVNQAQIFNLGETEEEATANEDIITSSISVIAGNGVVTVKGAAGKNVVITNVLGQTVANTVVASDEAQISTPAGVVVVAVEGEAAVKAIVK